MPKGVPKDVGSGVFRDKHGKIIPRERFSEDPDFDVEISKEAAYVATVRAGIPRDHGLEENLDVELIEKLLSEG